MVKTKRFVAILLVLYILDPYMPQDHADPQKEPIRTSSLSDKDRTKDIQKKNDLLELVDGQQIRTNPFGQNVSGDHLYRRVERIAAAIHLVTAHVPHTESLRENARSESTSLLDYALDIRSELRAVGSTRIRIMQASIRKLISLMRLLGVAGYVSLQNIQALVEALDELGNFVLTSQRSVLSEDLAISKEDLMPRVHVEGPTVSRQGESSTRESGSSRTVGGRFVKDRISIRDKTGKGLGLRSERILEILGSGGLLGIKDIISNLPEYSEKMVQRELAALVHKGRARKIGSKRWSKYQLA